MKRSSAVFLAALAATVLALALAAQFRLVPDRYNPLAPLDLAETPNLMTGTKLWLMEDDPRACVAALRRAGVTLTEMPEQTERPGCIRRGTITLSKLHGARIRPEEMRCDIALRLYLLDRHDLQPLARQHLGSGVAEIVHFGSYSCRNIRGRNRLSQHATANAFDIAGFRLVNGRTVSLTSGWDAGGATSAFLHDLRGRACLLFNMVLSPDYNADHADHFHVDMGPYMGCN